MYSQNGYKVDRSLMATYTIPGSSVRITLRRGDASVVLLWFAGQFNTHIQPVRQIDTGGFVIKGIEGGVSLSNHASGTAMDLRWNDHPMWRRGTFAALQVATIRRLLSLTDGAIRWGGDYVSRADEMHFEINTGPGHLHAVADRIRSGGMPATEAPPRPPGRVHPAGSRELSVHTPPISGTDVAFVQRLIGAARCGPADGLYGPHTAAGVRWYQGSRKVAADGIVGPVTWHAMGIRWTGPA